MRSSARCRDSPGGCRSRHAHALHRLGVREAEQARGRRVGVEDDAVAVQEDRRGRALEQLAVARLAGGEGALGADLVGDVAGDAAVAVEHAFRRVARLAADAVQAVAALRIAPAHDQVGERPVRLEVGAMAVELRLAHADVRQLPGGEAELLVERRSVGGRRRIGDVGEAEIAVLLPVPVGHQAERVVAPAAPAARRRAGAGRGCAPRGRSRPGRRRRRARAGRGRGGPAGRRPRTAGRARRKAAPRRRPRPPPAPARAAGAAALCVAAPPPSRFSRAEYGGPPPARPVPPRRRAARRARNRRRRRRPGRARRATS